MNNFAFNCLGSQQQRTAAQLCGGDRGTKSDSESGSDRRCASCCGCFWVVALLGFGFGLVQFRGFALVAFGWGRFVDKLTRRVPKQRRRRIRPIPLGG